MELRDKKVLVVGLGRSGVAVTRFLASRGAKVTVTDLEDSDHLAPALRRLEVPVELRLGGHREADFLSADCIVLSPGVPATLPLVVSARRHGVEVIGEIELAFRFLDASIIGVTGSNGKTTTTTLIGEILDHAGQTCVVAGNIGRPLTDALLDEEAKTAPLLVVELSSFQLEAIESFRCHIAVFLNLTPDHLDRHADTEEYFAAKKRIFLNQETDDWAVINQDDPVLRHLNVRARRFAFSLESTLDIGTYSNEGQLWISSPERKTRFMQASEVRLRGKHNLSNVLAASSAAFLAGVQPSVIAEAVRNFRGVEHRLELVRRLDDVDYYNDSKATNVDSAVKAIEAFDSPLVLIMGGLDKGGDFSGLRKLIAGRVRQLILIGKAAGKIEDQLGATVPTLRAASLEEAVGQARSHAQEGDVVLLAPGCASFDMFTNYEERGRAFKAAVQELPSSRFRQVGGSAR